MVIKYDFESEVAPPTYSPEVALVVNVSALALMVLNPSFLSFDKPRNETPTHHGKLTFVG